MEILETLEDVAVQIILEDFVKAVQDAIESRLSLPATAHEFQNPKITNSREVMKLLLKLEDYISEHQARK